jgi:hypothetical protein
MVPASLFLHVVRDGRDVVASIVDRARRYPDDFPRQLDPGYGIRQWNASMEATQRAMRDAGHLIVPYRRLAESPDPTLQTLCEHLGIDFEPRMLGPETDASFVTDQEPWKAGVSGPVAPSASKFSELFDETQQTRISQRLNWSFFREVEDRTSQAPGGVWISDPTSLP